ncbi:MAG: hypothetical protein AAB425_02085 [Bdellovibrionota bacterium]
MRRLRPIAHHLLRFALFLGASTHPSVARAVVMPEGWTPVRAALSRIESTPEGRRLVEAVFRTWHLDTLDALEEKIVLAEFSRTDALITRHFDPATGMETREKELQILIRADRTPDELALDLAHELEHASIAPAWDPYDPALTAGKYMHATIAGPGGEVDALVTECLIARRLLGPSAVANLPERAQVCRNFAGEIETALNHSVSRALAAHALLKPPSDFRAKVLRAFFKVGPWYRSVQTELGAEKEAFPFLSDEEPDLFSSTGNAPYPAALLREYVSLNRSACENTLRRMEKLGPSADTDPRSILLLRRRCVSGHTPVNFLDSPSKKPRRHRPTST